MDSSNATKELMEEKLEFIKRLLINHLGEELGLKVLESTKESNVYQKVSNTSFRSFLNNHIFQVTGEMYHFK